MKALSIDQMSREEKLRAMEELWISLSQDEGQVNSPPWHQGAVREAAVRYEGGQEQPVDWAYAKKELRTRAE